MKTGFELLTKMVPKRRAFSVTFPLLTTAKGEKLGKSAGNALWLDEALLSPYEFFQFFYNTADQIIDVYLKLFTFCPISEIDDLMKKHQVRIIHYTYTYYLSWFHFKRRNYSKTYFVVTD